MRVWESQARRQCLISFRMQPSALESAGELHRLSYAVLPAMLPPAGLVSSPCE